MARLNGLTSNLAAAAMLMALTGCPQPDPCEEDLWAEGCLCDTTPTDAQCLVDADADGYLNDVDCNDSDAAINPGAAEPEALCDDGIDQNCDGVDGPCPIPPEPYAFFVNGGFGFDGTNFRTWIVDDGSGGTIERKPFIDFTIVEEAYFDAGDDRYACDVVFEYDGPPAALTPYDYTEQYRTSSGSTASASIQHDAMVWDDAIWAQTTVIQNTCTKDEGHGFDPDVWGDDMAAVITQWSFGIGVGNARPDIATWLDQQLASDPARRATYFGGGVQWEVLAGGGGTAYTANSYAYAVAVDESFNLILDGEGNATPLQATDALAGAPGVYIVSAYGGFYAEYLL